MEKEYQGSVVKRLLGYALPYYKQLLLALFFVLAVTGFELYRPMLIGDAIDLYIEGYNKPYAVVEKSDLYYNGEYLSHELEGASEFKQLVMYQDDYYLFENLNKEESDALYQASLEKIDALKKDNTIILQNKVGEKLSTEELKVLRQQDFKGIKSIAVIYVVVLCLNFISTFMQTWLLQKTGQNIIYEMRKAVFHHIHTLPLKYFDTHPIGKLVTRVTNDVESIHEMYAEILSRLFKNAVKIIGLASVMLVLNLKLAIYSFILLPVIFILTLVFQKISRKVHRIMRNKLTDVNTFLSENISGMSVIQIFTNEYKKYKEFTGKTNELYQSHMKQIYVMASFRPLIYFISQIALALVLYKGSVDVIDTTITLGTMYVFINYISNFFEPIQDLAEQFATLQNAFASAEKIFTVLDEENAIKEIDHPIILDKIEGRIEFKHVWFAYVGDNYVLKDVSFTIEPGQSVAFVGATGAGKSSILSLVGRYYDIQKGEILLDGINIQKLSIKQIREAIGQVQQDVFIFTGDISSNIRLLNDEITDEKIIESARAVNASSFIEKLPHQYHEEVSERGSTLSTGQRQLLSFARTLAFNPQILVMDEATANIDTETEGLIQDAIEKLMENRTTIMVAHRLSTIQHCDNIIVLHHGEIVESGNHQELLSLNGMYKNLYELQKYEES